MSKCTLDFSLIAANGDIPMPRAFHIAAEVNNKLIVHGGMNYRKEVLNELFTYDVLTTTWSRVQLDLPPTKTQDNPDVRQTPKSESTSKDTLYTCPLKVGPRCITPALSHHTVNVFNNRFLIVVGGWNGRKRQSDVYICDTESSAWYTMPVTGNVPTGLSSHTSNFYDSKSLLIIGREGGVLTQRRFGSAFILNIFTGEYAEFSNNLASRSGHSCILLRRHNPISENALLIYGGRNNRPLVETIRLPRVSHITSGTSKICKDKVSSIKTVSKLTQEPDGRQHHVATPLSDSIALIHGGETWKGARENISPDVYLYDRDKLKWYYVNKTSNSPKLMGHSLTVVNNKILLFGGNEGKRYSSSLWCVNL